MLLLNFTAASAGQQTLTLVYRRPWEKNAAPASTYTVNVVVK
ncbi:MAG: protease inhibitor I42 family protein [Anaerolineaceae bacterium]|nr:protease inhibitor I42 family protein [Anaerolineaceae bacterium]